MEGAGQAAIGVILAAACLSTQAVSAAAVAATVAALVMALVFPGKRQIGLEGGKTVWARLGQLSARFGLVWDSSGAQLF